jgi:hypothetical protein
MSKRAEKKQKGRPTSSQAHKENCKNLKNIFSQVNYWFDH